MSLGKKTSLLSGWVDNINSDFEMWREARRKRSLPIHVQEALWKGIDRLEQWGMRHYPELLVSRDLGVGGAYFLVWPSRSNDRKRLEYQFRFRESVLQFKARTLRRRGVPAIVRPVPIGEEFEIIDHVALLLAQGEEAHGGRINELSKNI